MITLNRKSFISERGGVLLEEYNNALLKIRCAYGHIFYSSWKNLKNGKWCRSCSRIPKKYKNGFAEKQLQRARDYSLSRGGECLSSSYVNNRNPMVWKCKNNHIWESNFHNVVVNNSWCPLCIKESQLNLNKLKRIAADRGGVLLSKEYKTSSQKLKWKCYLSHVWGATVGNVVGRNSWCPYCSAGLYENICRTFLEILTGEEFPKGNPDWLKNRYGNRLELDGFCPKLGVAFEHNGLQHYFDVPRFRDYGLTRRIENDNDKINLCNSYNIKLLIIPELNRIVKYSTLQEFIEKFLLENNIVFRAVKINYCDVLGFLR